MKELESAASEPVSIEEGTYAKEQLNVPGREGATLLGLPWDKENDTVGVNFPQEKADLSKRGKWWRSFTRSFNYYDFAGKKWYFRNVFAYERCSHVGVGL